MAIEYWRKIAAVLLFALAGALRCAAQAAADPPKELMLYVRDAQRRGIAEAKIRQQAQTAGWSAALVDKAIGREPADKAIGREPAAKAVPAPTSAAPEPGGVKVSAADDYQIGAGDSLQISVWKEPDVTVPSVVVRPDGKITVPLIKEVQVAGLTPRQVEVLITDGLSKYITDPNVTVVLAAINSKRVYVIGAVKKEGALAYNYGMTVMQALSESGGLTDYARRRKIYILRSENGREYRLDFNYEEVVRGERPEQNAVLLPGDTVVIPH
jgi:polysaccharide export outer membrane protein